jgi:hypothetical protein
MSKHALLLVAVLLIAVTLSLAEGESCLPKGGVSLHFEFLKFSLNHPKIFIKKIIVSKS